MLASGIFWENLVVNDVKLGQDGGIQGALMKVRSSVFLQSSKQDQGPIQRNLDIFFIYHIGLVGLLENLWTYHKVWHK